MLVKIVVKLILSLATILWLQSAVLAQVELEIKEHRLKNGLTLIMHEDHSSPIISFQVWYNVGSRNERPGITGISHLFEHMMFKGSKNVGPEEHSRIVNLNGGADNAFTTEDTTAYFENLPGSKLAMAAELEADRMASLLLTAQTLASEREVVKEERRLRIDNSLFGTLAEQLYATAFSLHPYRWPVNGWMSDLDAINLEDCQAFYRSYYATNNTTVLVLGDIDPQETISTIEKYFGHLAPQERPREAIPPEPPQKGKRQADYHVSTQFPWLAVAHHIPEATHPDVPVLELIENILSQGHSSRLYKRIIYQGQMAQSVSASVDRNKDPGLFVVTITGIKEGHSPEEVESIIYEELERLKGEMVEERELLKARNQLEAGLIFSLQTNFIKGIRMGLSQVQSGDPRAFLKDLEKYRKATSEDVLRVAKEYFTERNRTVLRLLPEG